MSANRAAIIDTIDKGSLKQNSLSAKNGNSLKLADSNHHANGRLQRLAELASSLMTEAQVLARDKAFAEESEKIQRLDVSKGLDFYSEVRQFETALIKLALEQAQGNQARAARLLGLRATTLNSKIKLYAIQY